MKKEASNLKTAGLLIGLGIIYFIIAMIVAEAVYPGYSVSNNYISDLGVGNTAVIFDPSIVLLGVLLAIGAYLLHRGLKLTIFPALVFITGISAIGVGIFNESFGIIHGLFSAAVFLFGAVAAIYFGATQKTPIRYPSIVLGVTSLTATVLFLAGVYLGLGPGGMERMIVYPILLWGVIFAGRFLL